jgi:predicted secreted hydrolase
MEKFRFIISIIVGSFIFLFLGIFVSASDSWFYVTGPCHLKFPEDHGPHPGFRTEWWYYTGNVSDNNGVEFGFQLTFFRRQIGNGSIDISQRSGEVSPWRTQQLILAHAALTEISEKKTLSGRINGTSSLGYSRSFPEGVTAFRYF